MREFKDIDLAEIRFGRTLELKANQSGDIEGLASAFGVPDSHGDIVEPGAFRSSIEEHRRNGSAPAFL